jgi:hypothetical protein
MRFLLRPNQSAALALEAFLAGPAIVECAWVIVACQYAALLDVLGREKFDALFGAEGVDIPEARRMLIHGDGIRIDDPLSYFVRMSGSAVAQDAGIEGHRPGAVGEKMYFRGVLNYLRKHPAGCALGWNVLYAGRDAKDGVQRFVGFGLGGLRTESELRAVLVQEYNKPRTPEDRARAEQFKGLEAFDASQLSGSLRNLLERVIPVPDFARACLSDQVPDRPESIGGFDPRSSQVIDPNAVLLALREPAAQTIGRMTRHREAERHLVSRPRSTDQV